jgi:hypothetical protein
LIELCADDEEEENEECAEAELELADFDELCDTLSLGVAAAELALVGVVIADDAFDVDERANRRFAKSEKPGCA